MRKSLFIICLCVFLLSACTHIDKPNAFDSWDNNKTADHQFEQFLNAVEQQDIKTVTNLFSINAQLQADNIDMQASDLLTLLHEDITFCSSAKERGVSTATSYDKGKSAKEIQASFYIETETQAFYVAFLCCTEDSFDPNNIGVTSVYIISAKDWNEEYVYRAGGQTVMQPGIHIQYKASDGSVG